MNKVLTTIGICVTLGYAALITYLLSGRFSQFNIMPLNEVGDFLAGIFGPLAIFWLILGFIQQGKELKQNTEALELQAQELRNSVEQQKELVSVSRKQFEADLQVLNYERERHLAAGKPNIVFQGCGGSHSGKEHKFNFNARNTGAPATSITLTSDPPLKRLVPNEVAFWVQNQDIRIDFEYEGSDPVPGTVIIFHYTDSLGNMGQESVELIPTDGNPHPSVKLNHLKANKSLPPFAESGG